jgi:hypothetical protein
MSLPWFRILWEVPPGAFTQWMRGRPRPLPTLMPAAARRYGSFIL